MLLALTFAAMHIAVGSLKCGVISSDLKVQYNWDKIVS